VRVRLGYGGPTPLASRTSSNPYPTPRVVQAREEEKLTYVIRLKKKRYMNMFISTWVLLVAGLVFAFPMIHMRVQDHTDETLDDLYVSLFFFLPFDLALLSLHSFFVCLSECVR
jgi:hypothetical protein